jgi:DNA-binding HxlR family transcriptional regulator
VRGLAQYDRRVNDSPLAQALERVGDRWTLLLVDALLGGPRRFNELLEDVVGIAPNTLTQRLRHLEREALLVATPYSERPRRFEYQLTESGRELAGALRLLAAWGSRGGDGEPLTHAACGTPLEARWYCSTCSEAVDETETAAAEFV